MTFTPKDWRNDPDPSTPLSAEAMEDLESRLSAFTDQSSAAYGTSGAAPAWNLTVTYGLRDWVTGSDGRGYFSLVAGNLGNDPTQDDGTNWSGLFGPNPMLNVGDMIIGGVGGAPTPLSAGKAGQVQTMLDANTIGWSDPASNQQIQVGQVTITVPGGSSNASVTVNHGLGVAPGAVIATSAQNWSCSAPVANFTTNTFQLTVWRADGTTGGGSPICQWAAYSPVLSAPATAGQGTKAKVGATVALVNGGPLDWTNAQAFDSYVGRSMATVLQKVYLSPGELPTNPKPEWVTFMGTHGGKLLISFRPNRAPFSTSQDNAFATLIANCYSTLGHSNWKAVLWQEPNTNKNFGAGHAGEYHTYVNHYGPIFRANAPGIDIVYDPALGGATDTSNAQSCLDFYPGDTYTDGVYVDFYGGSFTAGSRLDTVSALADNHTGGPVPFGIGEWGWSAGRVITQAQFDTYNNYLKTFFKGRLNKGLPQGWIIYWGSNQNNQGGSNPISSSSDPKIPDVQLVYDALNAP